MPAYDELELEVIEGGFCPYCGACTGIGGCIAFHRNYRPG